MMIMALLQWRRHNHHWPIAATLNQY